MVDSVSPVTGKMMYLTAFFVSIGIISWQEITKFKRVPLPSRFVQAAAAFGILAAAEPIISPQLAGTLGWGLLMGLAYEQTSKETIKSTVPNGVTPLPLTLSSSSTSSSSSNTSTSSLPNYTTTTTGTNGNTSNGNNTA